MIEKQRQVIIFGDFGSISLDDVSKCTELFNANTILDVAPDMLTAPVQNIAMRPMLVMGNTQLFIGSERIHFQEIDGKTDDYNTFLSKALELFKVIVDNFKVSPNRIACNGIFTNLPDGSIDKVKNRIFKENILGNNKTITDWNFNINHQIVPSNNFTVKVNQVITSTSNAIVTLPDNSTVIEPLIFGYDCNTDKENLDNFSMDDCKKFTDICQNFRKIVINLL